MKQFMSRGSDQSKQALIIRFQYVGIKSLFANLADDRFIKLARFKYLNGIKGQVHCGSLYLIWSLRMAFGAVKMLCGWWQF